jgi:hypothetical protein
LEGSVRIELGDGSTLELGGDMFWLPPRKVRVCFPLARLEPLTKRTAHALPPSRSKE